MFDLPQGKLVEEEIDVSDGTIQSFAHGVIQLGLVSGRHQ